MVKGYNIICYGNLSPRDRKDFWVGKVCEACNSAGFVKGRIKGAKGALMSIVKMIDNFTLVRKNDGTPYGLVD